MTRLLQLTFVLSLFTLLVVGCAADASNSGDDLDVSGDGDACSAGTEGCECIDGACLNGLMCVANRCDSEVDMTPTDTSPDMDADVMADTSPDSAMDVVDMTEDMTPAPISNIETVTVTGSTGQDGNHTCLRAACPSGKKALGGGALFRDTAAFRYLGPSGDDGWELCLDSTMQETVSVDVHCANVVPSVTVASQDGQIGPGADQCVTVTCPGNGSAFGGGGGSEGDVNFTATRPAVNAQEWIVCGHNNEATAQTVTASVLCVGDNTVFPRIVFNEGNQPGFPDVCISAACPTGTRAVGGGGGWASTTEMDASRQTGINDWSICGTDSMPTPWRSLAVCATE